jgi:Na+/melibiose symporter-like transporter
MDDVFAVLGILLALGIIFPGMLTAWWLLFPSVTARAQERVQRTPWSCLGLGIGLAIPVAIAIALISAIPFGVAQFFGLLIGSAALAIAGLGAAGIAAAMSERLQARSEQGLSDVAAFVRGALALELAAAFPVIGWVLFIPLTILVSFGAAIFSLLRSEPKPNDESLAAESALSQA